MTSGNNIETEYLDLNAKNEWPVLFEKIRSDSVKGVYAEATKPQNRILNRYRDVSPYDDSRIILLRGSTDYINANLIKVEKANRQYILTQGPLASTVSHFWLMVWEQNSKAVLMLNKLIEKKQEKCFQYWPSKTGGEHIMQMTDVGLSLEYLKQQDHSYYYTRELKLTDTESGESRNIIQFHYITWPDFGVPTSPTVFLEFLRKVRAAGVLESSVGPAIVHCSAGIGRSGTFCLVDSCLVLIEKFGQNSVDVKEILLEMRKYRMGLIQTHEQLRFSYQAIIEGAKQLLNPNSESELEINNGRISPEHEETVSPCDTSDEEPPPLPPPRGDSLPPHTNGTENGPDRPLPSIPVSVSCFDINYEHERNGDDDYTRTPLPKPPVDEDQMSSEDEIVDDRSESPDSVKSEESCPDTNTVPNSISPSTLRKRTRDERRSKTEDKVRDIKRRQQINEQWTQLKRSLYYPLVLGGTIVLGSGLFAYFYFKS